MIPLREEDYNKTSMFDKNFKFIRKAQDPRFGEISILQDPNTKNQIIVRERKVTDKAEAGKLIAAAKARMNSQNPYSLKLLDYSATKQSELCSTVYIVRQFWEMPAQDLKKEFINRQGANQPFTEPELSNIIYQVVKADPQGLHGDISPANIAYDRATTGVKLIDRSEEPPSVGRTITLQKNKVLSNQPVYCSNNIYSNLKRNNLRFQMDPSKEDAFSLGLTALELGNLKSVNDIYNSSSKEIDRAALQRHLDAFNARYPNQNGFLNQTVMGLTRYDENQRLGMREVESSLPSEVEFRNRLAQGTFVTGGVSGGAGGATTTTTTTTTNVIGGGATGGNRVTEFISNTTQIPPTNLPSIYSQGGSENPFYTRPVLPNIPNRVPIIEPKYTPPPMEAPIEKVVEVRNEAIIPQTSTVVEKTTVVANPLPAPINPTVIAPPIIQPIPTITNIQVDHLRHEFRTGGSIVEPQVIHDYKGADVSYSTYSGSYTPGGYNSGFTSSYGSGYVSPVGETYTSAGPYQEVYYQGGIGQSYGGPNRIVLEPEYRKEFVSSPMVQSYTPSVQTFVEAPTSYAPQVVYTSAIPTTTVAAPTILTENITSSPVYAAQTVVSSPSYISSPTVVAAPVSYVQTMPSAQFISTTPTVIGGTSLVSSSPNIITTGSVLPSSDGTSVSGLKLVRSYQDPKFAT